MLLVRLDEMAVSASIIARYRQSIAQAHPLAFWQLGIDARRFSARHIPGGISAQLQAVTYFCNPDNRPESALRWLDEHSMNRIVLENTTHCTSVDQPEVLTDKILEVLR